jgi:cell division protein FtsW (lipid II flippase)
VIFVAYRVWLHYYPDKTYTDFVKYSKQYNAEQASNDRIEKEKHDSERKYSSDGKTTEERADQDAYKENIKNTPDFIVILAIILILTLWSAKLGNSGAIWLSLIIIVILGIYNPAWILFSFFVAIILVPLLLVVLLRKMF